MSTADSLRSDFRKLREEWQELDPTIRFLDIMAIASVVVFGVGYILVSLLKITLTATNAALLIFPLIAAGYIYVYRGKLANENIDNDKARREFFMLIGLTIALVLLTIVYALFINTVV